MTYFELIHEAQRRQDPQGWAYLRGDDRALDELTGSEQFEKLKLLFWFAARYGEAAMLTRMKDGPMREFAFSPKMYRNALHDAAKFDRTETIQFLFERKLIDQTDIATAIFTSTMHGCENATESMLRLVEFDEMNVQYAFSAATGKGHVKLAKRMLELGADVNVDGGMPLIAAAGRGDAVTCDFLLQNGARPDRYKRGDDPLSHARKLGHESVVAVLEAWPRRIDLSQLEKPGPVVANEDGPQWLDENNRKCAPPKHLEEFSPYGFKPKVFSAVREWLRLEGCEGKSLQVMAHHLSTLLRSKATVAQYVARWGDCYANQPVHDLAQFRLPRQGQWHIAEWGDATVKFGPGMAKLIAFSERQPLPEATLVDTRRAIGPIAYRRAEENPQLAALCFKYYRPEHHFEYALNVWREQRQTKARSGENIPELNIDGARVGHPEYRLIKLAAGDVRALMIGDMVECCHSIGKAGEKSVAQAFRSPNGAFYAIESKRDGDIVAEAHAWRGKKGELVLDSLQYRGSSGDNRDEQNAARARLLAFVPAMIEDLRTTTPLRYLHIGTSGKTPSLEYPQVIGKQAVRPLDPEAIIDAYTQYRVPLRGRASIHVNGGETTQLEAGQLVQTRL